MAHLGKIREALETALVKLWLDSVGEQYQPLFHNIDTSIILIFLQYVLL